ncbi:PDZ domain-containing protein, partial [Bartonella sp. CL63NXGY]|uniref:PDZ domain-containing protein n=1 Tax=Bartonella sp. CL63NXGY TaxID=3243538 RepID=UPI0035D06B40
NHHSVAARAGLQAGDRVTRVGSQKIDDWTDLSTAISERPGKKTKVTYQRNNRQYSSNLTPKVVKANGQKAGQIGILEETSTSMTARLKFGWERFVQSGTLIFSVLGHMFTH